MKDQHLESSIFGDSPEPGATSGETGTTGRPERPGPAAAVGAGFRGAPRRPRRRRPGGPRSRWARCAVVVAGNVGGRCLIVLLVTPRSSAGPASSRPGPQADGRRPHREQRLDRHRHRQGHRGGGRTGDAGRTIGVALQKAGVVKTPRRSPSRGGQPPGGLHPARHLRAATRMSAASALDMLLDPANRSVPRVTVREGLWKGEVIKALSEGTGVPLAEYQAAPRTPPRSASPRRPGATSRATCSRRRTSSTPTPARPPSWDHGRQGRGPAAGGRGSRRPTRSGR